MIAKSLKNIMDNPLVLSILDRSQDIGKIVNDVMDNWSIDMFSRNPTVKMLQDVEDESLYDGTDLDLFTVLYSIAARKAVINIPEYENLRAATTTENQVVISKQNRHGQIFAVESNKKSHSFSMMIRDVMVIETKNGRPIIGAPRNFNVTNDYGEKHEGIKFVDWLANPEEEAFFEKFGIDIYRGNFAYEHFVHPNRWRSFLGSPNIISKILDMRINDMAPHYRKQAKELKESGVRYIGKGLLNGERKPSPQKVVGESVSITVPYLETKIWGPMLHGEYPIKGLEYQNGKPVISNFEQMPTINRENQRQLRSIRRYGEDISDTLSHRYGPMARSPTKAADLSVIMNGLNEDETLKNPGWGIPDREYTKFEGGKKLWNKYSIGYNLHLLYRITQSSVQVAK